MYHNILMYSPIKAASLYGGYKSVENRNKYTKTPVEGNCKKFINNDIKGAEGGGGGRFPLFCCFIVHTDENASYQEICMA